LQFVKNIFSNKLPSKLINHLKLALKRTK